jgi:hypothetical protein
VIVAVLYDAQGAVINFGEFVPDAPRLIYGSRSVSFEICVPPPNDGVSRFEVQALGR